MHALVRALAGQLVTFEEARRIERAIVRRAGRPHAGLFALARARRPRAPLGRRDQRLRPRARAGRRRSCASRRSSTSSAWPASPPDAAAARLLRERQLGPWSVGTFFLHGLGRYDRGLVGDLGLIRLCGELLGRRAEAADTAELLERYGEWAGLASLHLLRSAVHARGLTPSVHGLTP